MLQSILIKNTATYDRDIGVRIQDLKKINFLYGANGCGKTTITKYINDPQNLDYKTCELNWHNDSPLHALVYNKDFREKNFGKGSIPGVFTLGQATGEEVKAIDTMVADLSIINTNNIDKKNTLDRQIAKAEELQNSFKELCWTSVFKKHELDFKDGLSGFLKKEAFKDKLLQEAKNNTSELKSLDEIKEKSLTILGKRPTELKPIGLLNFSKIVEIEKNPIWTKKIIGKGDVEIAKLIQSLNINDWVNEGRNHLQENMTCPFCQENTITDDFKRQLESYFDETFTKDIELVNQLSNEYQSLTDNIKNFVNSIESNEKQNPESKIEHEKFSAYCKAIASQFSSNIDRINSKVKEPSRTLSLMLTEGQLEDANGLISKADTKIKEHNDIVINFDKEKNNLVNIIWKYFSDYYKNEIDTFNREYAGLTSGIAALEAQCAKLRSDYSDLNQKIKDANKNVTGVQASVDQINKTLKSYGFSNFSIVPSKAIKNHYQVQREDETLADSTLSEGEITFITFLYFLELAKGGTSQDNVSEKRILVVDDPISSLDSNVLFIVSSLLKEIIKKVKKDEGNIKQIIVLTHNVYFHKEVSFVDGKSKNIADTAYWILRKNHNVTSIESYKENPINSSYELLWKELRNSNNNSGITIQNIMRRIIENYFKIMGKYGDDDLINKFEDYQEQEICRSLICWINDGSHTIPDDIFIEQQASIIEKYFVVFEKVFNQMGHPEHYKMMMRDKSQEMAN